MRLDFLATPEYRVCMCFLSTHPYYFNTIVWPSAHEILPYYSSLGEQHFRPPGQGLQSYRGADSHLTMTTTVSLNSVNVGIARGFPLKSNLAGMWASQKIAYVFCYMLIKTLLPRAIKHASYHVDHR